MKKIDLSRKIQIAGLLTMSLLMAAWPMFLAAADAKAATTSLDWAKLVIGLFGGLGIFLFGMEQMSASLKNVAGDRMKDILAKLSNNRVMGLLTGTVVTAIIQSSSVTTVMLVGFVTAGLMSFSQSIAIILGANIGTTITAQIVAFKVTKYALVMIAVGVGMQFFSKKEKVKQYGLMLMGLGLVFYGMSVMSGAMKPLRSYQPFLDLMAQMDNPILGILVAAAFTGLVQSSSATTGVVIVLGMQGLINLEAGIALILGSNIGTCITAGLAAIGKPREAVRVAMGHVAFNVIGVILILPFIPYLAELARFLSPTATGLSGQDLLAAEVPRQIANSHTVFNVGFAILFLPFTTLLARAINRLTPDQKVAEEGLEEVRYMDPILLETPALALEAARHETQRVGFRIGQMLEKIVPAINQGTAEDLDAIDKLNEEVDTISKRITEYLSSLSEKNMGLDQTRAMMNLIAVGNELGNISELIRTDMTEQGQQRIEKKVQVPDKVTEDLGAISSAVSTAFIQGLEALEDLDQEKAKLVLDSKITINELSEPIEAQHLSLLEEKQEEIDAYSVFVDVVDKLKRVNYHSRRMARNVSETIELIEDKEALQAA